MKLMILSATILLSLGIYAQELILKLDDKVVKVLSISDLSKGKIKINSNLIKQSQTKLFNAWRGYSKKYVGYNFVDLMDSVYGDKWRKSEKIIFKALDGYSPFIRTSKMLVVINEKKNEGILAYKEANKDGFTSFKRGENEVNPGPFYLVWTNFSESDKATYGDILKWPYQLKEINVKSK